MDRRRSDGDLCAKIDSAERLFLSTSLPNSFLTLSPLIDSPISNGHAIAFCRCCRFSLPLLHSCIFRPATELTFRSVAADNGDRQAVAAAGGRGRVPSSETIARPTPRHATTSPLSPSSSLLCLLSPFAFLCRTINLPPLMTSHCDAKQ